MAITKIQSYDDLQQLFENKQYEFKQRIKRTKGNVQFTQIISCPLSDKRSEYQNEMEKDLIKILGNKNVNYGKGVSGRITDDKSKNLKASVVSIDDVNYSLVYKDPSKPVTKTKTGEFEFEVTPAKIKPSIVNEWLTAQEMADRIITYIKNLTYNKEKIPETTKKAFYDIVKQSLLGTREIDFAVVQSKSMAYFAEALSAINLAKLIEKQDRYILDTLLDMPSDLKKIASKNKNKIKIYLPLEINFPLIDFLIDYKGTENQEDALKISVKSKLPAGLKVGREATGETNTVKFQDLFGGKKAIPANVDEWYNSLQEMTMGQLKKNQFGPKVIAYSAVLGFTKNSLGNQFPIYALSELLNNNETKINQKNQLKRTLKTFGRVKAGNDISIKNNSYNFSEDQVVDAFERAMLKVGPEIGTTIRKQFPLSKVFKGDDLYILEYSFKNILKTEKVKDINLNISNLIYIAERVLAQGSKKDSISKYNFYLMFYENVLKKQHVIYAVPTRYGPNRLKFKYLAMANWNEEYHKWQNDFTKLWMELRQKTSVNKEPGAGGALAIAP